MLRQKKFKISRKNAIIFNVNEKMKLKFSCGAETLQESSTHGYLIPVKFQRQSSSIHRLMVILVSFFVLHTSAEKACILKESAAQWD